MVDDKNQLEEYKYAILMIGGSIIITILLSTIIGGPLWKSLKKDTESLKVSRVELEFQTKRLTNLKELASKEAELKEKNAKVLAALPEEKDISRLFVQFESIASQSGLAIDSVTEEGNNNSTIGSGEAKQTITPLSYGITARGSGYQSLKNTLVNFENALRLVSITSINISANANEFAIKFVVTTYKRG